MKTGVYRGIHYFSYFCSKHRLWYSLEPPRHNLCFEQEYENILEFLSENFQFLVVKFSVFGGEIFNIFE